MCNVASINPLAYALSCSVIATNPRCHLDREGEIFCREHEDFSLCFEMTAGAGSWPLPCREHEDFTLRFEMTAG
jgi:hypothetical protein